MGNLDKPSDDRENAPPTWVRWRILALLLAFSFMTWFNRATMASAYDERLREQYGISEELMGTVYSAFFLVYTLFMTPGGWFVDRFGARLALVVMGLGSALFAALTGSVILLQAGAVVTALALLRGLMGLVSAPIYPACGRSVAQWIPYPERAWANGLVTCAAPIGIACTFVGFGALIDWVDWPLAFAITGGVTALVALLWMLYGTNRPEEHRGVNAVELRVIEQDEPAWSSTKGLAAPTSGWHTLLRNRSLILLTVSYAAVNYVEYLFTFWMNHYFVEVLHFDRHDSRYYTGIVKCAEATGMALGGWLSYRLQLRYGHRWGRAIIPVVGLISSSAFLVAGLNAQQPGWIVAWFALTVGAVGMCEGPFWTTAIELGGPRGGTAGAICNTGGNVGGLIAPQVTPVVSKLLGWQWGLGVGGIVCVLGAGLWWWIDPAERCGESEQAT